MSMGDILQTSVVTSTTTLETCRSARQSKVCTFVGHSALWDAQGVSGLLTLFNATSPGAAFDSNERHPPPKCHPGTRVDLIKEVTNWIDSRSDTDVSKKVLWLHGPAGAGKSAIAQSIAEDCDRRGILAASFFFSRAIPGRNSIDRLFTTIAYQIAISTPDTQPHIQRALSWDPSIVHKAIHVQLQKLIIEPLQILASSSHRQHVSQPSGSRVPSLVLIDGLDECAGNDNQRQILNHVLTLVSAPNFSLRLLIVSRPEYNIRDAFERTSLSQFSSKAISVYGDYRSREDVRVYLLHEFSRIHVSHVHEPWMATVPKPWPSKVNSDLLVERSDGYFIYAATLIRFVDQEDVSPIEQLDIVLSTYLSGSNAFGELDKLYHQILSAIRDTTTVKVVLGALLSHVPPEVLADMFALSHGQVSNILRRLPSVFHISCDTAYPIHKSFSDFLFDPARSGDFHIDPYKMEAQTTLAMVDCVGRCSSAYSQTPLGSNSGSNLHRARRESYNHWFRHLKKTGTYKDITIRQITATYPHLWVLLPPQPDVAGTGLYSPRF
ncbi:hypothetical protein FPV67DRAFT_841505 [Lyophyllum atratum]|nr:hypothetical protein FPV67DRAFT_841505 [Lyophyllum atratum]